MGGNSSKSLTLQSMRQQQMSCTDDLMCQNIDSRRSVPGQDLVLVCPDAMCVEGKCQCGDDCERDPYTGICCKDIETRVTTTSMGEEKTTFCIEGPDDLLPNSENKVAKNAGSASNDKTSLLN